ncbi:conserved exported hypothetical protein [Verrucomicrobia bacterium]|nr:conserved exported hypothetical protein [Verrucomicrobiota bacterium]
MISKFLFPLVIAWLPINLLAAPDPSSNSRLGINLSGIVDWNTEHPCVDVFRLSRAWISQKKGQPWGKGPQLDLDEHGWVKRLEPDCFAETPVLTGGHAPVGDYVCLYDGDGEIRFGANSQTISRAPGRIVVHIDGQKEGTFLSIRQTNPTNPVRAIRLLMPGFEKTYLAEPFSTAFLNRWRGFNTIRFMDWMDTNGSKQKDWADRPRLEDATWALKGVPVEVMVNVCNRLKANPWFCMPHLVPDDYVRRFAALVKEKLDPSLKVYIEYSNEVWNGIFEQHRYAEDQAKKTGLGPNDRPWEGAAIFYARRSVEIFGAWEQVFGGHSRLVRVIAWQAAGGAYWTDNMLLAQAETPKHCDVLAIAPYISFMPSPENQNLRSGEVAKWTVAQVLDRVETNALAECIGWIKTQKAVADKYGLKLVCYEAGQHLVGVGGGENNEALTKLLITANRHPRMGVIYTQYMNAWRNQGGGLMCLFSSVAVSSKWGSWGLLEGADENSAPKFDAVIEWNRQNML